jgi:hypothetical protein
MIYTKYLINEQFIDIDSINTKNVFLQLPMMIVLTPIALSGILLILGLLPMTASVDYFNYIKSNVLSLIKYGHSKISTLLPKNFTPLPIHIIPNTVYLQKNIRKVIRSPGRCLQL